MVCSNKSVDQLAETKNATFVRMLVRIHSIQNFVDQKQNGKNGRRNDNPEQILFHAIINLLWNFKNCTKKKIAFRWIFQIWKSKFEISVREITKMKINVPSCPAKSLPGPASRVRPPHETVGGETRLRYWLDSWSALKTWINVTSPWWNIFYADWRTDTDFWRTSISEFSLNCYRNLANRLKYIDFPRGWPRLGWLSRASPV